MKSQTRQARAEEHADVERRRALILATIAERGPMTTAEIRKSVAGTTHNTIGYMVRMGKLVSVGEQKDRTYSIPGKNLSRIIEEPGITMADIWVRELPKGTARMVKETHSYSVASRGRVAIQSSVPVMMMYGG